MNWLSWDRLVPWKNHFSVIHSVNDGIWKMQDCWKYCLADETSRYHDEIIGRIAKWPNVSTCKWRLRGKTRSTPLPQSPSCWSLNCSHDRRTLESGSVAAALLYGASSLATLNAHIVPVPSCTSVETNVQWCHNAKSWMFYWQCMRQTVWSLNRIRPDAAYSAVN